MRILAAHGDVQGRSKGFCERAEEMRDQLGRQFADPFAVEASFPYEEGPARDVERDLHLGFVHGQQEPVARAPALVAQALAWRACPRMRRAMAGQVSSASPSRRIRSPCRPKLAANSMSVSRSPIM